MFVRSSLPSRTSLILCQLRTYRSLGGLCPSVCRVWRRGYPFLPTLGPGSVPPRRSDTAIAALLSQSSLHQKMRESNQHLQLCPTPGLKTHSHPPKLREYVQKFQIESKPGLKTHSHPQNTRDLPETSKLSLSSVFKTHSHPPKTRE